MNLALTLGAGLFTVLGAVLVFLVKDKNQDKVVKISMNLAIGSIITLIILDLLPEIWEILSERFNMFQSTLFIVGFTAIGIIILKVLDKYVHNHDEHHTHDCEHNYKHIGIVTALAISLHNIIEGMAVYGTLTSNTALGIKLILGVGLHNIPLGMMLASAFYKSNNSKLKTLLTIVGISLTSFIGGLIMFANLEFLKNELVIAVMLLITNGMLIYIAFFELLPQVIHLMKKEGNNKEKIKTIITILIGAIVIVVAHFIGGHSHHH